MIDTIAIFLSVCAVVFTALRAAYLDSRLPWFGEADPPKEPPPKRKRSF